MITKENMTVRDAMNYLYYDGSIHSDYAESIHSEYEPNAMYIASDLVDDYNLLVTLITERFGGAIGRVDFKRLENYTSEEVNQMIDNYLEEELVA